MERSKTPDDEFYEVSEVDTRGVLPIELPSVIAPGAVNMDTDWTTNYSISTTTVAVCSTSMETTVTVTTNALTPIDTKEALVPPTPPPTPIDRRVCSIKVITPPSSKPSSPRAIKTITPPPSSPTLKTSSPLNKSVTVVVKKHSPPPTPGNSQKVTVTISTPKTSDEKLGQPKHEVKALQIASNERLPLPSDLPKPKMTPEIRSQILAIYQSGYRQGPQLPEFPSEPRPSGGAGPVLDQTTVPGKGVDFKKATDKEVDQVRQQSGNNTRMPLRETRIESRVTKHQRKELPKYEDDCRGRNKNNSVTDKYSISWLYVAGFSALAGLGLIAVAKRRR
jgi:hypothetical protein